MLAARLDTLINEQALARPGSGRPLHHQRGQLAALRILAGRLGDSAGVRVTYLDGVLEIMSPRCRHESGKTRIGTLLKIYFLETETAYFPLGSTTLRSATTQGGTEPDESYCSGAEKALPDLAIEVVATSGEVNKLAVYGRLGISEIWFRQDNRFSFSHLRKQTPLQFRQTLRV